MNSKEFNLPFYLTGERAAAFKKSLKDFDLGSPVNYFQGKEDEGFLQGDTIKSGIYYNFELDKKYASESIILSNSCDISDDNPRDRSTFVTYAPLVPLKAFEKTLIDQNVGQSEIESKINDIKSQRTTQFFYLPASGTSPERIALLDQVESTPISVLKNRKTVVIDRLSQIGWYLFLFKLTFHFARTHENVERAV